MQKFQQELSQTQRRSIYLLSTGHLCVDIAQGALPALLPFLISEHGLSFAQAGILVLAMSASSSFVQPVFGYFADRFSKPWFMAMGLLLAGLGISIVGLVHTYSTIALAVAISGFGIAGFHPEGARLANNASGANKATAMSIFSFGGNMGFACGPLLAAGAYMLFGLRGTLLLAAPSFAMAMVLLLQQHQFTSTSSPRVNRSREISAEVSSDSWHAFTMLSMIVILRSVIFYGIVTFLPLFLIHVLGQSEEFGSTMLTVFFGIGAIGTLLGGRLADRFGNHNIIKAGFVVLFPILFLWLHMTTVTTAVIMLVPLAIIYYAPFSAIVVLGQQYLPNRVAFASGVTLGLAVSIGGAVAPFLGKWADVHGVRSALLFVAFLPVLCGLISFLLPARQS